MSIYGEQWVCTVCTWHNVFVRQKCRNCAAPRALAAQREPTGEFTATYPLSRRPSTAPSDLAQQRDAEDVLQQKRDGADG